jgi:hypothetical protein
MRNKVFPLVVALSIVSVSFAETTGSNGARAVARKAVSENSSEAAAAIATLRARGQLGLDDFLAEFSVAFKNRELELGSATPRPANPEWQRLNAALDQVCQQHDCYASRLFWYTDLKAAKAAAKLTGKPILSLRLLGKLDEELTCANSRFFRLTLYSNAEVSTLLRERFILLWQSVRPVPKVTIDFGDGRKLERTLTGNSIHYVLDSDGRPIDALPGLYGPQAFIRELSRAERISLACRTAAKNEERGVILRQYHTERINELAMAWAADIASAKIATPPSREPVNPASASPSAEVAARAAVSKRIIERPIIGGISDKPGILDPTAEDAAWARIAQLHLADSRLDASSTALIRAKNLKVYGGSEPAARAALVRTISSVERAAAIDTVRNEFVLHTKIHEWFALGGVSMDLDALNERVYRELFLTPSSDPWLGLFPLDGYTGIENDGVSK